MSEGFRQGRISKFVGRPLKLTGAQRVEMPRLVLKFRRRPENWDIEKTHHSVDAKASETLYSPAKDDSLFKAARRLSTPIVTDNMFDENSSTRQESLSIPAETKNKPKSATRGVGGSLDIYVEHFGLVERPFSLVPDPDFLFWSSAHRRAFTMLEYGVLTRAPITLITGEVGAGKTTLVHHLLKTIGEGVKIGMISNAHGSRGELLRWVLMALDQPAATEATYVDLFAQFQTFLIEEYARGNRVILIFDEAQNLSRETLEELRMFTNINANKDELLQLVLVGQPELREMIHRPDMRQFAQRVAANFHLSAMDEKTVHSYVGYRLRVAGAARNFFSKTATQLISEATGGVPRLVNQLCDLSMVYAFTKGSKSIMRTTVQQVLDDGAFFGANIPESKDDIPQ
ncbi:MAG: AAA family ATPase [Sulfitobacter sp.]